MFYKWMLIVSLLGLHSGDVAAQVINELLASPAVPRTSDASDVVELFNPTDEVIDLSGIQFVIGASRSVLHGPLVLNSRAFHVIHFDPGSVADAQHVPLSLPSSGGTLMLLSSDGSTVLDMFTYPALPPGVSIGRMPDGGSGWSFFPEPGFGRSASRTLVQGHAEMPDAHWEDDGVHLTYGGLGHLRYTLDGSTPTESHGKPYGGGALVGPGVLRVRAFAPRSLSSEELTIPLSTSKENAIHLCMAPTDLWDPRTGIHAEGERANFSRKGEDWERFGRILFTTNGATDGQDVGVRISGSGSRGFPKRSFRVASRGRFGSSGPMEFPLGEAHRTLILRADATPHSMVRALFLQAIVHAGGDRVDMRPADVLHLYLNGAYWGAYRILPAKDDDYLQGLAGGASVDVLEGPEGRAVHGRRSGYEEALLLLRDHAPMAQLAEVIDPESLVDLAFFDLYTGRADHDLNVRCWRPSGPNGRWRWVLYDVDLWADPDDPSLERIRLAPFPSAPFLDNILTHPELRERFAARCAAYLATALDPAQAMPVLDSVIQCTRSLLERDHERWKGEMLVPSPEETYAIMRRTIKERGPLVLRSLADHMNREITTMDISAGLGGKVLLEGLPIIGGKMDMLTDVSMHVEAVPDAGMRFIGWKGPDDPSQSISVKSGTVKKLKALFGPAEVSGEDLLDKAAKDGAPVDIP